MPVTLCVCTCVHVCVCVSVRCHVCWFSCYPFSLSSSKTHKWSYSSNACHWRRWDMSYWPTIGSWLHHLIACTVTAHKPYSDCCQFRSPLLAANDGSSPSQTPCTKVNKPRFASLPDSVQAIFNGTFSVIIYRCHHSRWLWIVEGVVKRYTIWSDLYLSLATPTSSTVIHPPP